MELTYWHFERAAEIIEDGARATDEEKTVFAEAFEEAKVLFAKIEKIDRRLENLNRETKLARNLRWDREKLNDALEAFDPSWSRSSSMKMRLFDDE